MIKDQQNQQKEKRNHNFGRNILERTKTTRKTNQRRNNNNNNSEMKQSNQMINTQDLSVAKSELQRKVQAKLTTQ